MIRHGFHRMYIQQVDHAAFGGGQFRHQCLCQEIRTAQVAVHQVVPLLNTGIANLSREKPRGIVNQQIQLTGTGLYQPDEPTDIFRPTKIRLHNGCTCCPLCVQFFSQPANSIAAAVVMQKDIASTPVQGFCNTGTNTPGRPGDESLLW